MSVRGLHVCMQKEWRKCAAQLGREAANGSMSRGFRSATTQHFRLYACSELELMAVECGNVAKVLTTEVLDAFRTLSHTLVRFTKPSPDAHHGFCVRPLMEWEPLTALVLHCR